MEIIRTVTVASKNKIQIKQLEDGNFCVCSGKGRVFMDEYLFFNFLLEVYSRLMKENVFLNNNNQMLNLNREDITDLFDLVKNHAYFEKFRSSYPTAFI